MRAGTNSNLTEKVIFARKLLSFPPKIIFTAAAENFEL
jgi:hypothetical protein